MRWGELGEEEEEEEEEKEGEEEGGVEKGEEEEDRRRRRQGGKRGGPLSHYLARRSRAGPSSREPWVASTTAGRRSKPPREASNSATEWTN